MLKSLGTGISALARLALTALLLLVAAIATVFLGARPHRRAGTQPPSAANKES